MSDCYEWFDPFKAKNDSEYWEERSYFERRDLERELDMARGAVKATQQHIRYMTDQMAKANETKQNPTIRKETREVKKILSALCTASAATWAMQTEGSFWFVVVYEAPVFWFTYGAVWFALSARQAQAETEDEK